MGRHPGGNLGACPDCGKLRYTSRRGAKAASKVHPGQHLSAYPCGEYWHYGHPPRSVMRGYADRSTLRPRP